MTPPTLQIELVNQTSSKSVFAHVTGLDLGRSNAWVVLRPDGTPYYPSSPSEILQPLGDCGIPLGKPGSSKTITIPRIAGGRIYFSIDKPLVFLLNPGPALVEPSPTNPSDPNYNNSWDFCEFTFNDAQLFANISYVDFVALPIALTIKTAHGETKHVAGTGPDGLTKVCAALEDQHTRDSAGWDSLIVKDNGGQLLRALSPNNGIVLNDSLFKDYWSHYIDDVWSLYGKGDLTVDTQAAAGFVSLGPLADRQVRGNVSGNELKFSAGSYQKPSAYDIFGCSSGPFAPGGGQDRLAITPRLAAAFNRSTLYSHSNQPCMEAVEQYYAHAVTNHYARIVHDVNLDGRGYAFPYDDVVPSGGDDVAGTLFDADPELFIVTVGGRNAHV